MASSINIPTIDLSASFMLDDEISQEGKKKEVTKIFKNACTEYGLFQVVNHGVPVGLLNQATGLCKEFFDLPLEEKLKFHKIDLDGPFPVPHGYLMHPAAKNEQLFMFPPGTPGNIFPTNPPKLQLIMEELFTKFTETSQVLEGILNDCMGLPPNFLKNYNNGRGLDLMLSYRYSPATGSEDNGSAPHQDPNFFTLIWQDDIGGLQLLKDGEWINVAPAEGALVFHISDVLQVLSNNNFMSPFHQVVRHKEKSRYSFAFLYNLNREQWVKPFPQFTKEIGEPAKYRTFQYKEYFDVRAHEKVYHPARPEDKTRIISMAYAT